MEKDRKYLHGFVKRFPDGRIVPGSLIITENRPRPGVWEEVTINICCDDTGIVTSTTRQKAWVQFTKDGKIIPGSMIITEKRPKVGVWGEVVLNSCCELSPTTTTTTAAPLALRLLWDNIGNAPVTANDLAAWNTYFDLPLYGTPFTSVEIVGNEVRLYGGANIQTKANLFSDNENLLEFNDDAGSITELGDQTFGGPNEQSNLERISCPNVIETYNDDIPFSYGVFGGCYNLDYVYLPLCSTVADTTFFDCSSLQSSGLTLPFSSITTLGKYTFQGCTLLDSIDLPYLISADENCFANCTSLTSISLPLLETAGAGCFNGCISLPTVDLPLLETAGNYCFEYCTSLTSVYLPSCTNLGTTVGDDGVFDGITLQTITVIVPDALLTCNGGNPDGDLQYLIANNTVLFPLRIMGDGIIGDPSNVADWNTFFDLPTNGTPFTSVYYVSGSPSITYLFGGFGITLKDDLFNGLPIEQILDNQSNCIIAAGLRALANSNLTTVDLPSVTTIGNKCFGNCYSLTYLSIPVCTAIGDDCGDNLVFNVITGQTITLIVSPYVMDCGGSHVPDGDIATLIANNTVEIPLVLKFNGSYPVVDPTDVTQWNTLFDLPTLGTEFTSVTVGSSVYLYGGANITLNQIVDWQTNLVEIIDANGCITALGGNCFKGCIITAAYLLGVTYAKAGSFQNCFSLTTAYLDKMETIEGQGFQSCIPIQTIYIPSCTNLGGSCGNDVVFDSITGQTITLTVPNSIYTNCGGSGLPDADITVLQTFNTVTVIGV